jgi:hypothetical protein
MKEICSGILIQQRYQFMRLCISSQPWPLEKRIRRDPPRRGTFFLISDVD